MSNAPRPPSHLPSLAVVAALALIVLIFLTPAAQALRAPLLALATPLANTVLFADYFDAAQVDSLKWRKVDSLNKLSQSLGFLNFLAWKPTPGSWGDPALYTVRTFQRQGGLTVSAIVRPTVADVQGPYVFFSPTQFPANPAAVGYGTGLDSFGLNGGRNLHFGALLPSGTVSYNSVVAQGDDYVLATTLRPSGSYHFAVGGNVGTFPTGTLLWVNDAGAEDPLYVGVDARQGSAYLTDVKVQTLTGSFATQYGLAAAGDTFGRTGGADGTTLGTLEIGGAPWINNGMVLVSNALTRPAGQNNAVSARFDSGVSDGIFETTFRTPPSGFVAHPALYFRYQDADNWLRVRCTFDAIYVDKRLGGVETVVYGTGAVRCDPNTTYRLVVRAHGSTITAWLNDVNIFFTDPGLVDSSLLSATGVQVGIGAGNVTPTISRVLVWPMLVTFPPTFDTYPTRPDKGPTTLFRDVFEGPNGSRLQDRVPEIGGRWTEDVGTWTIQGNDAVPSGPWALATIDAGRNDYAVTTTINLSSGSGWGTTNGWEVGPVLRYSDPQNYVFVRYLWQNASPEIEIFEIRNGVVTFLNAKNITGLVTLGSTHVLRAVVVGQKIAMYSDGELILQAVTTLANGTRVGLGVQDEPINMSSFHDFVVMSATPDTAPPSPVMDLTATAGASDVTLSWTPVYDDAIGTRYYRVFRSTDGTLGTQINVDGQTTAPPYRDTSLTTSGTYYYTVQPVDWNGNTNATVENNRASVFWQHLTPTSTPTRTNTPTPTATATRVPGPNLLQNPSFETVADGYPASWWRRANAFPDSTVARGGSSSLRLEGPASGAATTYSFQTLPLVPGATYTLSGWAKTQAVTGSGVSLRYAQLEPGLQVWETSKLAGTADWTLLAVTFTAPANTQSGRVDLLWDFNASDRAWLDDVYLDCVTCLPPTATPTVTITATPPPVPAPNLLQNSSFETVADGYPANWWPANAAPDSTVARTGTRSLRLQGPASGSEFTYSFQTAALSPGATYTLSGWAKTQGVTATGVALR